MKALRKWWNREAHGHYLTGPLFLDDILPAVVRHSPLSLFIQGFTDGMAEDMHSAGWR